MLNGLPTGNTAFPSTDLYFLDDGPENRFCAFFPTIQPLRGEAGEEKTGKQTTDAERYTCNDRDPRSGDYRDTENENERPLDDSFRNCSDYFGRLDNVFARAIFHHW